MMKEMASKKWRARNGEQGYIWREGKSESMERGAM